MTPAKIAYVDSATSHAVVRRVRMRDIFRLSRAFRNRCQHRITFLGSADVHANPAI